MKIKKKKIDLSVMSNASKEIRYLTRLISPDLHAENNIVL